MNRRRGENHDKIGVLPPCQGFSARTAAEMTQYDKDDTTLFTRARIFTQPCPFQILAAISQTRRFPIQALLGPQTGQAVNRLGGDQKTYSIYLPPSLPRFPIQALLDLPDRPSDKQTRRRAGKLVYLPAPIPSKVSNPNFTRPPR